jgi:DNA-binding IclR family transcriptional regulator
VERGFHDVEPFLEVEAHQVKAPGQGSRSREDAMAATGTQAVDRAALLISTVVNATEPISFADLQSACDLPKSTTSRMLTALERSELLERTDDGGYVAGGLFWLYAARHDPGEDLVRLARGTLDTIGEQTHETVNLSIARGDRVVQVAQVDSQYLLGTRDWTQVDVPVHCNSLGKVFLAWDVVTLPDGELERPTEASLTDRDALRADLHRCRSRGWATTVDELEVGLAGVAVPVRGSRGQVVAALGVSGPTTRLEDRFDELGRRLRKHASELTDLLRGRAAQDKTTAITKEGAA